MKNLYLNFAALILVFGCGSGSGEFTRSVNITVINPLHSTRRAVPVYIPAGKLGADFNKNNFAVFYGETEIPSQYNQYDSAFAGIFLVLDSLNAAEKIELTIRYNPQGSSERNYPRRTQAELSHKVGGEWKDREYIGGTFQNVTYLRVPPQHKDHSWFIRYEGPGWESDKVGYRFYLDQRNAVDVFGKKVKEPVLHQVGLDGFDSYHQMQNWGMDVMKVGKSLGVGSIGYCHELPAKRVEFTDSVACRIAENGCVYSSVITQYFGWNTGTVKTNLLSHISIFAGTRITRLGLLLADSLATAICTGLNKDPNAKLFTSAGSKTSFGYVATFGKQSLNNDNLGIAVFFHPDNFNGFADDEFNHIVKLKPRNGRLTYYFAAAWEGEPDGVKTEKEFTEYINLAASELANPVQVIVQ